jgi:hypothetical protein
MTERGESLRSERHGGFGHHVGGQGVIFPADSAQRRSVAEIPCIPCGANRGLGQPRRGEALPSSPPHHRYDPSGGRSRSADAGAWSPRNAEFGKPHEDVQKCGLAAKAAGRRKVSREDMCKHITAYSAAELKWVKYV